MKLVIATPLYPPEIGGPATYARLLNENLPNYEVSIDVVKFADVKHLPKLIRHIVYFVHIFRLLKNADVVLALDPVSVGLPACIAAWFLNKPFVVKIVGDYAWEQGRQRFGITLGLDAFTKQKEVTFFVKFLRTVQTRVALRAQVVITPSKYLKNIVTSWGVSSEKIKVVFNSVQIENNGIIPDTVLKIQKPIVMTAGRLVEWKKIDKVIDAISKVPNVVLVVVGDGPKRESLEKYAKAKLNNRSIFTGTLSHKDLISVMRHSSMFVLNSSYEGLSHILIETQMVGVPTIATAVGGNSEVITNMEDGLLVPDGDTETLAKTISLVLDDNRLSTRLSKNAVASSERFSLDVLMTDTLKVLTEAVNFS